MKTIRILAIGSPFGSDAIAWHVADTLRDFPRFARLRESRRIELRKLDRPGVNLLGELAHPGQSIILDAVADATVPPGTVSELDIRMLANEDVALSCHGFGVAAALQLAEALGRWPAGLRIVGIAIPPATIPGSLDANLEAALPSIADAFFTLIKYPPKV